MQNVAQKTRFMLPVSWEIVISGSGIIPFSGRRVGNPQPALGGSGFPREIHKNILNLTI